MRMGAFPPLHVEQGWLALALLALGVGQFLAGGTALCIAGMVGIQPGNADKQPLVW